MWPVDRVDWEALLLLRVGLCRSASPMLVSDPSRFRLGSCSGSDCEVFGVLRLLAAPTEFVRCRLCTRSSAGLSVLILECFRFPLPTGNAAEDWAG